MPPVCGPAPPLCLPVGACLFGPGELLMMVVLGTSGYTGARLVESGYVI